MNVNELITKLYDLQKQRKGLQEVNIEYEGNCQGTVRDVRIEDNTVIISEDEQ